MAPSCSTWSPMCSDSASHVAPYCPDWTRQVPRYQLAFGPTGSRVDEGGLKNRNGVRGCARHAGDFLTQQKTRARASWSLTVE